MAALWGAGGAAGSRGARRARGGGSGAEPPPASPAQCCSLEEEEPGLHWGAASSDVPLEADGILGTMHGYLDSSVISILEDFSSLHEHKACLEAPNELSLLTAITEILDSTDDETLSPFDSTMDSELLALPRERESSSFQKFLSLSRRSPERGVPALDDAWGLGKVEPGPLDLPWDCPLSCLEEPAAPRQRAGRAPRAEQKLPRPQLRERSDGEEEEGPPGELLQSPEERREEAAAWPADGGAPCIISTAAGSLSELVRSMHPYCLPTLTVCLDPASEPAAQEFLAGPLVLEIVPGAGESLEIPVVLQHLGPAEEEAASGRPAGEEEGAREPSPPSPTQARVSPPGAGPEEEARPRAQRQESRPQRCTEALAGGKRPDTEKGRGRERARKSRKKQREGLQRGRAKPDGDRVGLRLRSTSSGQPPASQPSPSWAARPSVQVSTFLEKQLEQARKDGRMELRAARGRPRAAAAGSAPRRKGRPEVQEKPEAAKLNVQPAVQGTGAPGPSEQDTGAPGPSKQAPPCPGELPADAGPSSAEQGEGSWPVPTKDSTGPETGAVGEAERAAVEAAGWPPRPKALSLTEYRQRMLRRQPGGSHGKEGEKPGVSKWPSIPEPPTELAEIPCLMAPVRPPPSQPAHPGEPPSSQRGPEKPSSPPATAPLASREPAISQRGPEKPPSSPATAPLACKAPVGPSQPVPAPLPPGPQLPFLPSTVGAAPAVIPPAAATPYALYPPVPSWPCFGPPPAGYPGLPPPPPTSGSPSAFHLVPGLPPPAVAWPSPALPPPPFGPGAPCASMGWALGLQPPYWPGVPVPPPLVYSDLGAKPFPAGPGPEPEPLARGTACAHVPALVPSCHEPPAFTTQSARPVPAQPSARATSGWVCDPRRQSRPVGESPAPQPVGQPTTPPPQAVCVSPAPQPVGRPPQPVGESPAPQPVGESPLPQPIGQPPQPVGESPAPQPVGRPPALPPQPVGESPLPQPVGQPPQPVGESPTPQPVGWPPQPVGQPPALPPQPVGRPPALPPQTVGESPLPQPVGQPPQPVGQPPALPPLPVGESPAPQPVGQPPALPRQPVGESPNPQHVGQPPALSPQPVGQPPGPCPPTEAAAPAKSVGPSLLEGSQPGSTGPVPQKPQLPGPPAVPRRAAVALRAREESQPAKPWRHRLLVGPARPGTSKDIVQAFISEIGIEASDLSSLLEQFEKTEGTKELPRGQRRGDRLAAGNTGSESQQEKSPPDSLHAPELANIAGLTPPATPPHQLWKPLAAVSLLGKARSPGAVPQEGGQNTAKFVEAKPLPQSKPRGKGPAPSHVGCGDHDYCARGTAQPEEGSRLPSTPAPSELGSRWNVKRHQDITIKPPSSLPSWTLACSGLRTPPGTAPGSSQPLDHRTRARSQAAAGRSSPPTSVLLSPAASPCRDEEPQSGDPQPAAKRSLRCYRRRAASPSPRARASRSFSSTSNGASTSSSSSSSSRSRSRSLSPPPKRWRSCGSCGRSRGRSPSSASSYSSRSSSASRSRSRSPSPRRRSNRRRRFDYCDPPDHCQHQRILHKERAIEERRVVFIGKIPSRMTRAELRHRFSVFGDIEECTLHFRAEGDNYGFVTYRYAKEAFAAIESGHQLRRPDEQPFDLCFGGRRQFCRRNYADLDSNREDFDPAPVKSKFDSLDFDTLLKQAQRNLRR
ncbi:peroxisome proliferator-activated receptor gamma coactivator-related protein 1 isoform X3 [Pelodiscus sinensis]|uniref:peroxisome proliferator-activated receptor gamma coactivator-related protein 1 isoform X3 n=1 Tax=Pelodiscus sinensis TaxID=13735 RepID=UPI003F6C85D2